MDTPSQTSVTGTGDERRKIRPTARESMVRIDTGADSKEERT